jgi:hypothetical protein
MSTNLREGLWGSLRGNGQVCGSNIVTKALSVTVFEQLMIVTDRRREGHIIVAIANVCSQITSLNS